MRDLKIYFKGILCENCFILFTIRGFSCYFTKTDICYIRICKINRKNDRFLFPQNKLTNKMNVYCKVNCLILKGFGFKFHVTMLEHEYFIPPIINFSGCSSAVCCCLIGALQTDRKWSVWLVAAAPSLGKPDALGGDDVFDVRGWSVMLPSVFTPVNVASNIDETQRMMGVFRALRDSQLMCLLLFTPDTNMTSHPVSTL